MGQDRGMASGTPLPYLDLDRSQWAALRASTPLTLSESELAELRGMNEYVDLHEVAEVYLPLSRLLNLRVAATQGLQESTSAFLGVLAPRVPYVIGLAGSVAVGKSTTARILQALLGRWPDTPRVDLVTTDGFLHPNAVLEARGLMARKGFPESYDVRALVEFLAAIKSGAPEVHAPVYSHLVYDIVPDEEIIIRAPDIVIVEGLNVLQVPRGPRVPDDDGPFVSDFFDFAIYVDSDERAVKQWYVERFLALRQAAFSDPNSFFHHFTALSDEAAVEVASSIWDSINGINLRENILPTRSRADLILDKGADHAVRRVRLRTL
jgi:type I pantothenate kinase